MTCEGWRARCVISDLLTNFYLSDTIRVSHSYAKSKVKESRK